MKKPQYFGGRGLTLTVQVVDCTSTNQKDKAQELKSTVKLSVFEQEG